MFYKDSQHIYRVRALDRFSWLLHGFGTRLSPAPGAWPNLATARQIHSATCLDANGRSGVVGEGDALTTSTPGIVLGIKTADCVPILLVDEAARAVAAVHAGWRGTLKHVASNAIERLERHYGATGATLHAAIGPAIGLCCFEVGPEVAARFGRQSSGKTKLDLIAANRRELEEAGIAPERIYTAGFCTVCGIDEFESYRRDGKKAGRLLSVVGIRS